MKIAHKNVDYLEIDEANLDNAWQDRKYHLIKICFNQPNTKLCNDLLKKFKFTNRYIVSDNINFYNSFFKNTNKKYYVENTLNEQCILRFIKRNNKILLNFKALNNIDRKYILESLSLVLPIVEVIKISENTFKEYQNVFENWCGDIILE